jgi:hypothetical protein
MHHPDELTAEERNAAWAGDDTALATGRACMAGTWSIVPQTRTNLFMKTQRSKHTLIWAMSC